MEHRRKSYPTGSLATTRRKKGPDVWTFQWREKCAGGGSVKRKKIVGTVAQFPTKTAAERDVTGHRVDINALAADAPKPMTLTEVAEHYKLVELPLSNQLARTRQTYVFYIDQMILPKWGGHRLGDVKTVMVERWLHELSNADGTKSKCRAVMSILFRHAMRYEWTDRNASPWYGNLLNGRPSRSSWKHRKSVCCWKS